MSDTAFAGVRAERVGLGNQSAPPGFRRIGAIRGLPAVLQERGLDVGAISARGGVAPGALDDPENLIRVSVLGDLLAHCAELASCPHLGIALGARARLDSLGMVGPLMRRCDTLGDAIRALEAHLQISDRGALLHLRRPMMRWC